MAIKGQRSQREQFIVDLLNAQQQLKDIVRQRDELNLQILQWEKYIRDLSALIAQDAIAEQSESSLPIRDAIVMIMRSTTQPMNAVEIRNALLVAGFNFKAFKNHMAAIHNTLRRMNERGEVAWVPNLEKYVLTGVGLIGG